jgi:dynein heavy chain
MKIVLADEQIKLDKATKDTNDVLANLEISSAEAQKEGEKVEVIAKGCEADAARIAGEKSACMADLAKAQPYVDEAETAIDSIKPAHIGEIKKLPKPADIIKLVFDGLLILFKHSMCPVHPETLYVAKQDVPFFGTSFVPHSQAVMGDTQFLKNVQDFGKFEKDIINEETIEFMLPYMELEVSIGSKCRYYSPNPTNLLVTFHTRILSTTGLHATGGQECVSGSGRALHMGACDEVLPRGVQDCQAQARSVGHC